MDHFPQRPQNLQPVALGTLAALVGGSGLSSGGSGVEISGITLSSALVCRGDLFVALPGERTHGARFAGEAISRGALAVLTDSAGAGLCTAYDVPVVQVENPRAVLGRVAAAVYHRPSEHLRMLGVTGTQGKTTTTRLLEGALSAIGHPAAVVGTIGTRINGLEIDSALTTPEASELQGLLAMMVEQGVDVCAMELSSHALVLGRVDGIIFDVAAFLNLGRDHLDFHHDLADYFAAKAGLFTAERARMGITNIDDEHGRDLLGISSIPMQTMSIRDRSADWVATEISQDLAGSSFRVLGPDGLDLKARTGLVGEFNVANALCAIALATNSGLDPAQVVAGLAGVTSVPGRLEGVVAGQDFLAVVDYAHKPDAVRAALESLRQMVPGRVIVVLGAGGDRDQGKRPLMGAVAAELADVLIITDDNPRSEKPELIRSQVREGADQIAEGLRAQVFEIADRGTAIRTAVSLAGSGDAVLVAGKGHETGQEIAGVVHPFDDRVQLRAALEEA
ncbi:MAG TPA: UDP-N-acetylmuramoyl-L-alanyl-D-glutamate--2,6-diaminopimelate ligase [Marmoricola sp.]|nr:UDP-N-acetylmuramoyl-L-alanyl-D-glutamate--2,6-diaminopimelate ligase [Marmoricola sp.]